MPLYRIHRMKETPRLAFRSAAHAAGLAMLKPKDFELAGDVEATSPYGAWAALHGTAGALLVGDVLLLLHDLQLAFGYAELCGGVGLGRHQSRVQE